MSSNLKVVLRRGDDIASLEVVEPGSVSSVYYVWWLHNTKDQRILKISSNARRIDKFFTRRVNKLRRAGWCVMGGEAGEVNTP